MNTETGKAIEERMARWRMGARCVCAACTMRAYQDAKASHEGVEKLKAWTETPEGKQAISEVREQLMAAGLIPREK